jgi:hypothetical protein
MCRVLSRKAFLLADTAWVGAALCPRSCGWAERARHPPMEGASRAPEAEVAASCKFLMHESSAERHSSRKSLYGSASDGEPRTSAAEELSRKLEERRIWVSSAGNQGPSVAQREQTDEVRVPLRLVVHRLLEEWDVDSDSSEDDDDFCGWRVGRRALPVGNRRSSQQNGAFSAFGSGGGNTGSGRPPGRGCLLQ